MWLSSLPSCLHTLCKQSSSFNDLNILFCNFGLNKSCSHPFDGNKTKGKKRSSDGKDRRRVETSDRFQQPELRTNREEVVASDEVMGKERQQVSPCATNWGLSWRELHLHIGISYSMISWVCEDETQELKSKFRENVRAPKLLEALLVFWFPATLHSGSPKAFENNLLKIGQKENGSRHSKHRVFHRLSRRYGY